MLSFSLKLCAGKILSMIYLKVFKVHLLLERQALPSKLGDISKKHGPKQLHIPLGANEGEKVRAGVQLPGE